MKRSLFFLSFLLMFNPVNIIATGAEKDKPQEQSLYASYFLITESCKAFLYACFFDMNKVKNAKVACCTCNFNMDSGYLWGHCASSVNESTLHKLKNLIWNGSVDELSTFLLTSFEELQIKCPECFAYNGWYKVDQQSSSQA